ncbi:ribonuclease H-like domain-containing protein, partial [Tanacetum coccineum]
HYFKRHKQVLKTENPVKRIAFLENEHSKSFAKWLRKEVERELAISKESVSETVRWISYGLRATVVIYDAYNINGYTFRTKCHDGKVYQNSGVSVEAIDLHISKEVATTRQVNHKAGGVKHDNLGYTLVDLNNLGHKLAFTSKHLHIAFADCICTLHLYIAFAACICKQAFAHCICRLNSGDESEVEIIPKDKTVSSSTEKIKFVKSARETIEKFVLLYYVCDKKVIRPVWNNSSRVNHKNFANKMTHPHPNRRFVSQAVLTRSGKINTAGVSVNTAVRPVNTVGSKPTVNHPRPISNAYKRDIHKVKDTTARDRAVVSENKGKWVNVVKASTYWVWKAKNSSASNTFKKYSYIDAQGRSKSIMAWIPKEHMTGNKCYLTEYEDYDGGFVSFGDGKGRISGKGKIKTGTLDFDNLLDECPVLWSPRKDNIYSVDLKSVVPTKGLTCLFAKATIDESNLWHRRLGHINFKNMNKLVRGNLVRGNQTNGIAGTRDYIVIGPKDSEEDSGMKPTEVMKVELQIKMGRMIKPQEVSLKGYFNKKSRLYILTAPNSHYYC